MQNDQIDFAVQGTLFHTPNRGKVEVLEDALVSVNVVGQIAGIHRSGTAAYNECRAAVRAGNQLFELERGQYLLPGLIDLHIHAPQWPQLGKALHLPLQEWLHQYTFPLEAKYSDIDFARQSYESLVDNLLANGTTTATYFGSVHLEATKLLADICLSKGQRALVGKVAMDNKNECPDYYRDLSTATGLDETRALIEHVRGMPGNQGNRVMPIVTPRFIPSCTDEMLSGLGLIAKEYACHIQTHCSESDWEHAYVIDRHGVTDAQSLDSFSLLTNKTVLAHANLIGDSDMAMIKSCGSGISHCPLSNIYFSDAVFPARRALDFGLNVGLGTDISGGPNASVLHNCRVAVDVSRMLEDGVNPRQSAEQRGTPGSKIDYQEAFWMATAGGAETLGLNVGQFRQGFCFDAMIIDANVAESNLIIWYDQDASNDILQKIIYNAERKNIARVWVQGRLVKEA